jgi:hypothetical protein
VRAAVGSVGGGLDAGLEILEDVGANGRRHDERKEGKEERKERKKESFRDTTDFVPHLTPKRKRKVQFFPKGFLSEKYKNGRMVF